MKVALADNDIDVDGVLMKGSVQRLVEEGHRFPCNLTHTIDVSKTLSIVRELFLFPHLVTRWNWHTVSDSIEIVRSMRKHFEIGKCITRILRTPFLSY